MFEARFQSFDDSSERAQSGARVAELRAELKRRGLDGFMVPRADRQQNEYLPASEERLAWLTGFTGSAGAAVVLADRAALFRRRPLHSAGEHPGRRQYFFDRASGGASARAMARAESEKRREARLRSLAAHQRPGRKTEESLRHGRRRIGGGRQQSDRRAVARPPRTARRRSDPARAQARRRSRARQAQAHPRRADETARRCAAGLRSAKCRLGVQHPRRGRRAYAAGACLRIGSARRPAGALYRRRASSTTMCATRWKNSPTCARRTTSPATSTSSGTKPSASIRRARPTRSPACLPTTAASRSAAPTRSHC